jgi:general secretion pathway protein H
MTHPRHEPRRSEQGFSLVEMLVVVVIVAAVAAIVMVSYRRSVEAMGPRTFVQRLVAELRLARATAVGRVREVAFVLNADARWYEVEGRPRVALPTAVTLTLVTAAPFAISRQDARLVFFADGSASGGRVTVEAAGQTRVIAVDWLTGMARVEEK